MFTIIGGDGQEYGPASVEQLRTWLASGRANLETRARKAGETDWKHLGDFAEFAPPTGAPPLVAGASIDSQLGGLGARFGAAFVDGFLRFACQVPTSLAIYKYVVAHMDPGSRPDMMTMMTTVREAMATAPSPYPYLAALAVLQGFLIASRSQSVGKILFNLRIVRAADGGKAGFLHAFLIRSGIMTVFEYTPILNILYLPFWLVDCCFIFRADRRCLHDLMAGTKVVKS
jgi:uncharacterized RDD family membrane protein YckC